MQLGGNRNGASGLALRIVGIGLDAKRNVGDVAFRVEGEHTQQTRGLTHAHHHDPGCHGVERAGMTDTPFMEGATAL